MATKVTITFTVSDIDYHDYENSLDNFLTDLQEIGIEDDEVTEEEI